MFEENRELHLITWPIFDSENETIYSMEGVPSNYVYQQYKYVNNEIVCVYLRNTRDISNFFIEKPLEEILSEDEYDSEIDSLTVGKKQSMN